MSSPQALARDGAGADRSAALEAEIAELRERMTEAEETLAALRNDQVDAIVVGEKVYALVGADDAGTRMRGEVLAQMEDAVVATDLSGCVIYMNPAAERQYGHDASAVLGYPWERLYQQFWLAEGDNAACAAALDAGRAWHGKVAHVTGAGRRLLVECTFNRMGDSAGTHTGYLSVLRDVSARADTEAALAESEALLKFALEAARVGLWSINIETGAAEGSAHHAACFGLTESPPGWSLQQLLGRIHPEDRLQVEEAVRGAIARAADCHFECRVVWPDHSIHWIEMHGNAYFKAGRPARMVGIVSEVTVRRSADEALREADRQKDEFLATLSHELRNPLAPIRTAAHVLSSEKITPELHARSVAIIGRQVGHMAHLLDDLLDVARITRRRMILKKDYIDLREAVETGIEEVRTAIDAKRHKLVLALGEQPIWLEADPVRMAQVVANLVNNACKYSNPEATIHVAASCAADGFCELVVRDTGIGLSAGALKSVFSMFAQEEAVIDRAEGGLGIGLALVKGLVELHGGSVRASSPGLGKGSTFVVRLPASAGPVDVAPGAATAPAGAAGQRSARILLADDNADAGESIATLLRMQGHEVAVATDGTSAFEMARASRSQLMLLDIGMPGKNGYELARLIRQEAWGKNAFLIATTGWGQDEDKARAVAAGFDAHLTKPFEPNALFALINAHLAR
jgi:PAS domain S-box-containing protein